MRLLDAQKLLAVALAAVVFMMVGCGPPPPPPPDAKVDIKNGFRDAKLGSKQKEVKGLKREPLQKAGPTGGYDVFERMNEVSYVEGITASDIRYSFLGGVLAEITILWEPRGPRTPGVISNPLYLYLVREFGEPTEAPDPTAKTIRARWEGRRVRMTFIEDYPEGNQKGRGVVTITDIALDKQANDAAKERIKKGF